MFEVILSKEIINTMKDLVDELEEVDFRGNQFKSIDE